MPTMYAGIIGYPLAHSISPAFQQAAFDHLGLDARYLVWQTPPGHLPSIMEQLRGRDHFGANITLPHKEEAVTLVDELDTPARYIGAVNTIVNRDRRLYGYNTDWSGFLRSLKEDAGFNARGSTALVLGAGGASRAVCYALAWEGSARIIISNRTIDRSEALAKELRGVCNKVDVLPWASQLPLHLDLLVNCTTVGLLHTPEQNSSPIDTGQLRPSTLVLDLVYNPLETTLLKGAVQAGCKTLNGLPMLVYQGAASFELWTERKAPIDVMMSAARQALQHVP